MSVTIETDTERMAHQAAESPSIESSLQQTADPAMDGFRDSTVARTMDESSEKTVNYNGVKRKFSQMMTFNRLVVGGVTLAVGVLVYNEVIGALPSSGGAINQSGITSTVESAFQLAPVALIVIVAAVILANVGGFRDN